MPVRPHVPSPGKPSVGKPKPKHTHTHTHTHTEDIPPIFEINGRHIDPKILQGLCREMTVVRPLDCPCSPLHQFLHPSIHGQTSGLGREVWGWGTPAAVGSLLSLGIMWSKGSPATSASVWQIPHLARLSARIPDRIGRRLTWSSGLRSKTATAWEEAGHGLARRRRQRTCRPHPSAP